MFNIATNYMILLGIGLNSYINMVRLWNFLIKLTRLGV